MTSAKFYACDKDGCPSSVTRDRKAPSGWVHVAATACRWATPVPFCPTCNSLNFAYTDTPWGINSDCAGCGYHHYFSIGD